MKHEIIKAKRIAKLQGQLKALRYMEQKINDEMLYVFGKLEKNGVEIHPDNFPDQKNDLIEKIKHFLDENISEEFHIYLSIDDDAELDILDRTPRWHEDIARSGFADRLRTKISKWEDEDE